MSEKDFVLDDSKVYVTDVYHTQTEDSLINKFKANDFSNYAKMIRKEDACRGVQQLKKDFDELAKTNNKPKSYYNYEKRMIDRVFACCAGGKGGT